MTRAQGFFPEDQRDAMTARFEAQTFVHGYEAALLSYARSDALGDYRPAYQAAAALPSMVLLGGEDHELPEAHAAFLHQTFGQAMVEVEGGGHGMHSVQPELINDRIVQFLGAGEQ